MQKPTKKKKEYYDYNECKDYIDEKLGRDIDDYAAKFVMKNNKPVKVNEHADFKCFWHWVVDRYNITNGCSFGFIESELEYIEEDWIKEIYAAFLEEFGKEIDFEVWW